MRNHGLEESTWQDTSDSGLLSKIYKELLKLNNKKATWLKKWANDLNSHLTKDKQMTSKYSKRYHSRASLAQLVEALSAHQKIMA